MAWSSKLRFGTLLAKYGFCFFFKFIFPHLGFSYFGILIVGYVGFVELWIPSWLVSLAVLGEFSCSLLSRDGNSVCLLVMLDTILIGFFGGGFKGKRKTIWGGRNHPQALGGGPATPKTRNL
jgi:hypothetical protein